MSPAQVQAFVRGYAPYLAASVASIRKYFPQAKIITYGNSLPASAPLIEALAHVRDANGKLTDYTKLVDGYGVHLYPGSDTTQNMVQETTSELRYEAAHFPHLNEKSKAADRGVGNLSCNSVCGAPFAVSGTTRAGRIPKVFSLLFLQKRSLSFDLP